MLLCIKDIDKLPRITNGAGLMGYDYKKNKFKKDSYINILLMLILYLMFSQIISIVIKSFLVKNMQDNSAQSVKVHISRLENSDYATDLANDFLEERLFTACQTVLNHEGELSNEFLEEISRVHKVDHIYWYNSQAKIEYTANDYLGWQASEGDPIYEFAMGDEKVLIEPIRRAEDSNIYTKYGQMKGKNGFVQVGILADKIQELTKQFCPQGFINDLVEQEDISYAYYLDNENKVIFCNDDIDRRTFELNNDEKNAIENSQVYYAEKNHLGQDVYEIIHPIYMGDMKKGSLIIMYTMESLKSLKNKLYIIALGLLTISCLIYIVYIYKTRKYNNMLNKLAYYDSVLGIYNQNYLERLFEEEITHRASVNKAIMLIKYKNYDMVRLNYGQEAVNNMLVKNINHLKKLPVDNIQFRYSEDTISVYLEDYKDKNQLKELSDLVLNLFGKNLNEPGRGSFLSISLGIIEIDKNVKSFIDLSNYIESLSRILETGKANEYVICDERRKEKFLLDKKVEKELLDAYFRNYDEFYLLYQPYLDLKTNRIVGVEVLARWENKELGFIPPDKFIDIAEKTNIIVSLGKWIIKRSCEFLKSLENKGIDDVKVAINISVVQLIQDDFVSEVLAIIEETKVNPKMLKFEITESALIDNYQLISKKLDLLRMEGISVSLDDFGTGHSSLYRLRKIKIDYLKIDKSFIGYIHSKEKDALINSIISMAKDLDLKVIAEGVEEEVQKEYLKENNCDIIQGYLLSRPIPDEDVISLIKDYNKTGEK
ncbi:MAG: EAL domain-containing protein [Epulopiscium sp.]|nr:EAL domain-containing protein [Candidatus Epulonipiscium sp.]